MPRYRESGESEEGWERTARPQPPTTRALRRIALLLLTCERICGAFLYRAALDGT